MLTFSNEFLQQLKDRVNIVDVISSYVPLKKKGKNYWACCPFHHERTPSFSVSPDEGFFYCFGCHASGDVITFIEKIEHLDFSQAVERLAEIAHVEIPQKELTPEEKARAGLSAKLLDLMSLAGTYFHNCLLKTNMGRPGLDYFKKRHLSSETIQKFQLGFAPPGWQKLFNDFTSKKNISPDLLVKAGLCGNRNGRYYDIFRNRCMFPILNLRGRVVAFGGRVMDDSKPKYLNSPESPIFNKRRLLFALYQALPEIKRKRQAIMVEGYMDAISLHAHGVTNAVASLGTAFTIEQARLLKRYADEIVFSYDMDAAGQNATKRALEIAGQVGLKLRVCQVGEGKDPDEFVNLHGGEAYLDCVKEAEPALDYLFHSLLRQYDAASLDGQQHILENMFHVLTAQGNSFQFNSYIRKMARVMHVDEGLIRSEAIRYTQKHKKNSLYISQNTAEEDDAEFPNAFTQKRKALEEGFIVSCLKSRHLPEGTEYLKDYQFSDAFCGRIFKILKQIPILTPDEVEKKLDREDVGRLAALMMKEDAAEGSPLETYIIPLRAMDLKQKYDEHTSRANELMRTDTAAAKKEMLICIQLSNEIRKLTQASRS